MTRRSGVPDEGSGLMLVLAWAMIAAQSGEALPPMSAPLTLAVPVEASGAAVPVRIAYLDITAPPAQGSAPPADLPAMPAADAPPAADTMPAAPAPAAGSPPADPASLPANAAPAPDSAAPAPDTTAPEALRDPNEANNRSTLDFNLAIDRTFLAPVAHAYIAGVPKVARRHITLVIANLNEPIVALNDLLQLHPGKFVHTVARFTVNSTIGIGGLFDVAGHHGLEHHDADFGQTLGRYGVHPGPYYMIPLLGPSDIRDGIGFIVDNLTDPLSLLLGGVTSTFGGSRAGGQILDERANADGFLRSSHDSTDFYATLRSVYGQHRAALVQEATGKTAALPDFAPAQ